MMRREFERNEPSNLPLLIGIAIGIVNVVFYSHGWTGCWHVLAYKERLVPLQTLNLVERSYIPVLEALGGLLMIGADPFIGQVPMANIGGSSLGLLPIANN